MIKDISNFNLNYKLLLHREGYPLLMFDQILFQFLFRDQIDSLDHRFNLEEKKFIQSVIGKLKFLIHPAQSTFSSFFSENADGFLKTSKKRIEQLELLNQVLFKVKVK